jgi:CBS domain-containing protein
MIAAFSLAFAILVQDPGAARAAGDQILSAGQAGDIFRNVSDGDTIMLKHPASGMICRFDTAASRNNIRIYPVREGVREHGDDVGCGTTQDIAFTVYATRYSPAVSEETAMAQAIGEIESIWGDVKRLDIATPPGAADSRFAAFRGRHPNGQSLSTVVLVRQVGPWLFKMRASGSPDQPDAVAGSAAERFAAQVLLPATGSR